MLNQIDRRKKCISIALLKEIEDLKSQRASIGKQLSVKVDKKVALTIDTVTSEFKNFFQSQGFKVEENIQSKIIAASYGSIGAVMQYHDPSEQFMGAITIFDLALKLPAQTQYIVALRRGTGVSMSVSVSSSRSGEVPEIAQQQEIEKLKKDLVDTQARLSNFDSEVWTLEMCEKDKRTERKTFPSMTNILETLIK